jgi:hypothetical protein
MEGGGAEAAMHQRMYRARKGCSNNRVNNVMLSCRERRKHRAGRNRLADAFANLPRAKRNSRIAVETCRDGIAFGSPLKSIVPLNASGMADGKR